MALRSSETKAASDSVVLEDGIKEDIVSDLDEWRHGNMVPQPCEASTAATYTAHLESGKTIVALAGELDYNI
jgi:hypothetical protein